jgi:hypothetical protein
MPAHSIDIRKVGSPRFELLSMFFMTTSVVVSPPRRLELPVFNEPLLSRGGEMHFQ